MRLEQLLSPWDLMRAVFAAFAWTAAWWVAAITLSFELASRLTPDALDSRFFFMWTFARSLSWGWLGFVLGPTFVFFEVRIRGLGTRESSIAGWRAVALGGVLGAIAHGLRSVAQWSGGAESLEIDGLAIAFATTMGATCGLATFLLDRAVVWHRARRRSATT
jgi:hypothetical protein